MVVASCAAFAQNQECSGVAMQQLQGLTSKVGGFTKKADDFKQKNPKAFPPANGKPSQEQMVFCLSGGVKQSAEIVLEGMNVYDEIETFAQVDPRKLTLAELGLSEEDLAEMDERQNPADSFEFDGAVWLYRQSADASAKRDDQPQPAQFYYWEFREENGGRLLAVRKPQGEPFAVSMYTGVPVADVTVYRRG